MAHTQLIIKKCDLHATFNIQHLKVNSNIDANADQRIYDKWNTIDFQTVNRCPLFEVMLHRQCCFMPPNMLYI